MTPFEKQLQQALQRQEPPADFTARVLSQCAAEDAKKTSPRWLSWRLSLATAAAVVLTLGGGAVYQQHDREVKGMAAKRQLLLAIHIAGSKLQQVQQRVLESEQSPQ